MANTFGGFVHMSPLSSQLHDPPLSLASNCVRDFFGPIVQTVWDALQKAGGRATLATLIKSIRKECKRSWNEERERLVAKGGKYKLKRSKGTSANGHVVESSTIRAALLVLFQHEIVTARNNSGETAAATGMSTAAPIYHIHQEKAILFTRYPRFIEAIKRAFDETAASVVETLLLNGKLGTVDLVCKTLESDPLLSTKVVVESIHRLVSEGEYLKQVVPFETRDDAASPAFGEAPATVKILSNAPYNTSIPRETVWRVNTKLLHDTLRAFCLGRLVAERYGNKVTSAGSMITAALNHRAKEGSSKGFDHEHTFSPIDIISYLPKPVQQTLEKKPGGIQTSLSKSLVDVSKLDDPYVLEEMEEAYAHPKGGVFSVNVFGLVRYLRNRTMNKFLVDAHGEVAARIVTILSIRGACEADTLAEAAMVPAKDTREILHRLYRDSLIQMVTLVPPGKQQSYSQSMIYLWSVDHDRMVKAVRDKTCLAMLNLRLRRQNETEVGKGWIERATVADDNENENAQDQLNYNRFCQGLERLDNAMMHLDETLMVLSDF